MSTATITNSKATSKSAKAAGDAVKAKPRAKAETKPTPKPAATPKAAKPDAKVKAAPSKAKAAPKQEPRRTIELTHEVLCAIGQHSARNAADEMMSKEEVDSLNAANLLNFVAWAVWNAGGRSFIAYDGAGEPYVSVSSNGIGGVFATASLRIFEMD
jgi:hypothetical protein